MILVRTDGSPTYNFAVVCDDANMGNHARHPRRRPPFEHAAPDPHLRGARLRGSHLRASVDDPRLRRQKALKAPRRDQRRGYRDRGYLADALVNFLALLGWSLDGETTIIDRETLCREFSLDRVTKKDAVFDETKLDWMNGVYIREMGAGAWADAARPWLVEAAALAGKAGDDAARIVATPNPPTRTRRNPSPWPSSRAGPR